MKESNENHVNKPKRKPFKWTRELVKLALHEGWTQKEIADKCRTQQSIVSAWSKGEKQGTEQQLKPLLEIFGYKLRRNTFKVYWGFDSETKEKVFYKVEGTVIFSQVFYKFQRNNSCSSKKIISKTPEYKIIVHHQGNSLFRLVFQQRAMYKNEQLNRYEEFNSTVDDAVWVSEITKPSTSMQLIELIETVVIKNIWKDRLDISDRETLLF
ncbi:MULTISPECIES: hypothetical protein [unclassified Neisseria]|uniref:helix-turn-helix domain-containing protein n=1 Tax=unclassified Neisseria TaxID=2623750 RepID=UPI002665B7D4|nr:MULTISPECIES: hypothetical protein [unclassified Neisseria]MDO1510664.1 hypothetical protein [Neisseria sp. MVDL19-042950]MDO1516954.1 hypothetical protein [Neisseria sp. MVDL18-041461]MDO1564316.1 hypothetical protein [Neisseria sp. MVDL20-010259]